MKVFSFLGLVLVLTSGAIGQMKEPQPPAVKTPFSESLQAVVVTVENATSFQGTAHLFERRSARSNWKKVGKEFSVVVGRSGLGWARDSAPEETTDFKQEGDGRSPAGMFPLTFAFGRPDDPGATRLSYRKLEEYSECVDDVSSSHNNRLVDRLKVGNFDWKSSEKMLDIGPEYDLGIFVAVNTYPVRPGDGSCIFLHVWKDASTGTSGCTAMRREDLQKIIAWLEPAKNPYLIQMTEADRNKYRKKWNLPR